jgi:hypothetical protein
MEDQSTKQIKKPLYFVPDSIGTLRYFERVGQEIADTYRISVLIMPDMEQGREQCIAYCLQRKISFEIIGDREYSLPFSRLPFFKKIAQLRALRKEVSVLVDRLGTHAFIAGDDRILSIRYLFLEANERRLGTAVLEPQEVLLDTEKKTREERATLAISWRRFFYKNVRSRIERILTRMFLRPDIDAYSGDFLGTGSSKKFGVVNARSRAKHKKRGVPEHKMHVVGNLSFSRALEYARGPAHDPILAAGLLKKHGLRETKRYIALFHTPYYRGASPALTREEYLELLLFIIAIIRNVFPEEHSNVILKLEEGEEKEFYTSLPPWVHVLDASVPDEDVVASSILYIGCDSSANFLPQIMEKQAIFLNFLDVPEVQSACNHYQIKHLVTDWREFKKLLLQCVEGTLSRQYLYNPILFPPDSSQLIRRWIGELA